LLFEFSWCDESLVIITVIYGIWCADL